jgi:hypothetical protein
VDKPGLVRHALRNLDGALHHLEIALADRQAAARSPAVATGLMNIASVLLTRGQHQWALAYLNEAIDIDRRSAPLDPVLSDRHAICRHRSTIRCRSACSGLSSCTQNAVTRT